MRLTNRSWDWNSLIMLLFEFRSHDRFVCHKNNHEIEIRNNDCLGFDLMIEVSTSWSILLDKFDLMNKHNFILMIVILISWKMAISISWNLTSWSLPNFFFFNCYKQKNYGNEAKLQFWTEKFFVCSAS